MVPPFLMANDVSATDLFPADVASMNIVYHDKRVRSVSVVEEDKLDEQDEADEQDEPDAMHDTCAVLPWSCRTRLWLLPVATANFSFHYHARVFLAIHSHNRYAGCATLDLTFSGPIPEGSHLTRLIFLDRGVEEVHSRHHVQVDLAVGRDLVTLMEEPLSMISIITESLGITCSIRQLEDSAKRFSKP